MRRVDSALGRIHVKVALVQDHGVVGILNVNIAIGDVVDAPVADVGACPRLQTGSILYSGQRGTP